LQQSGAEESAMSGCANPIFSLGLDKLLSAFLTNFNFKATSTAVPADGSHEAPPASISIVGCYLYEIYHRRQNDKSRRLISTFTKRAMERNN